VSRVALLQISSDASESAPDRIERVLGILEETLPQADIAVLPELWISGAFDLPLAREVAAPLDFPVLESIRAMAKAADTWVHAGSYAERLPDGRTFNTAALIGPDGELVATYRKRHLFGFATGERTLITAGDALIVAETPLGHTGIATCYDLRFPEMFRDLVEAGAETFLVASGWPTPRIGHWDVLTRARAIEDQAWMVACNGVGSHADITLGGHSIVIDPQGNVVAEAGDDETVLFADVEPGRAREWREAFPVLDDRL
jgi:predicted amidohydrolase